MTSVLGTYKAPSPYPSPIQACSCRNATIATSSRWVGVWICTVDSDVCTNPRSGADPAPEAGPRVITVADSPAADNAVGRSLTVIVGTNGGGRRRSATAMLGWVNDSQRPG